MVVGVYFIIIDIIYAVMEYYIQRLWQKMLNIIADIDKECSSDCEILFNNGYSNSVSGNAYVHQY